MSTLGSRLRAARERKGWSQTYVCQKLGISNSALSGYERDYREPDAEMIATLAELYDVKTDDLILPNRSNKETEDKNKLGGRAFLGGADKYTEEELAIARTAIEAYRKGKKAAQEEQ